MELSLSLSLYRVFIINIAYLIDCLILIKGNTIIMTDYVSIVRNADIFTKSYKSNISESQKSAFLKYRHIADRNIFRQCKDKLALDGYQIRSAQGIRRYWLLMSMAHFMCVTGTGEFCSFEKGYHRIGSIIQTEKYQYLFRCAKESNDFDTFMKLAG